MAKLGAEEDQQEYMVSIEEINTITKCLFLNKQLQDIFNHLSRQEHLPIRHRAH
ncbi:hypothetical protein DPMN_118316 [Dreissena polymorpha]|uniref:Uncharacterized protein n=1 Tax=Dreissena polymorpha TaxID=45954 RepID=A0A9D4GJX3_DREPO|nr:hypothetical protein DPMN_118316 [Dreissena polymorpha]